MAEPVLIAEVSVASGLMPVEPGPGGDPAAFEALLKLLVPKPPLRLFAMIDGARHPGLPERLGASGLECACLYDLTRDASLGDAAPWLVRLDPGSGFLRQLVTTGTAPWHGWTREGVLFLHSAAALDALRDHFRRLTLLPTGSGSRVYLRFWESDVLLGLLEATRDGWTGPARLFGPAGAPLVAAILAPDPIFGTLRRLRPAPSLPEGALTADARLDAALREVMRKRFARELAAHCTALFPDTMKGLKPADRPAAMADIADRGRALGLAQRGPLTVWTEACLLFGAGAATDPLVRHHIGAALRIGTSQMEVAELLHGCLVRYAADVLGPRNAHFRAALRRVEAAITAPRERRFPDLLREVWPQKVDFAGEAGFAAFLEHLAAETRLLVFPDLTAKRTFGMLCFFLGAHVRSDPIHAWILPALAEPSDRGPDSAIVRTARRWHAAVLATLGESA